MSVVRSMTDRSAGRTEPTSRATSVASWLILILFAAGLLVPEDEEEEEGEEEEEAVLLLLLLPCATVAVAECGTAPAPVPAAPACPRGGDFVCCCCENGATLCSTLAADAVAFAALFLSVAAEEPGVVSLATFSPLPLFFTFKCSFCGSLSKKSFLSTPDDFAAPAPPKDGNP